MREVELLRKLGCADNVVLHCKTVSENALKIADRVKIKVDKKLIKTGALLHDIGRSKTHSITHAVEGAKTAKNAGIEERIVNIIERHIGAGITKREAERLGLPAKDYRPKTPEEKIVAYADKLTMGGKTITFEESLREFERMLGRHHPAIKRMKSLHEEIQGWIKK